MADYTIDNLLSRKVVSIIDAGEDHGLVFEGGLCLLVSKHEPIYEPNIIMARIQMERDALSVQAERYRKLGEDQKFLSQLKVEEKNDGKDEPGAVEIKASIEVGTVPRDNENQPGAPSGVQQLQHEIKPAPTGGDS